MSTYQQKLIKIYGNPMVNRVAFERKHMVLVETHEFGFDNPVIPKRIYANKSLVPKLIRVLQELNEKGLIGEIKTWDGLYNVRYMRGSKSVLSRHSWGLAVDLNATWNPLVKVTPQNRAAMRKKHVKWSEKFLKVWRDNGFDCGADWKDRLDGMHFELIIS
jgi:hypothetical protein